MSRLSSLIKADPHVIQDPAEQYLQFVVASQYHFIFPPINGPFKRPEVFAGPPPASKRVEEEVWACTKGRVQGSQILPPTDHRPYNPHAGQEHVLDHPRLGFLDQLPRALEGRPKVSMIINPPWDRHGSAATMAHVMQSSIVIACPRWLSINLDRSSTGCVSIATLPSPPSRGPLRPFP